MANPGERIDVEEDTHRCSLCGECKPAAEMTRSAQRTASGEIGSWCKACKNARRPKQPRTEDELARRRAYYQRNKDAFRRRQLERQARMTADERFNEYRSTHLRRTYGITAAEYDALLAAQGGACAICRNPETDLDHRTNRPRLLAVDHHHGSGVIRGLLCRRCNTALGLFGDDQATIERVLVYLTGGVSWLGRENSV